MKVISFIAASCLLLTQHLYAQEVKTLSNLDASQGPIYLNLAQGSTVDRSANWDISLFKTTILVNSGTSGTGKDSAQVITSTFEQLTKAPQAGFAADKDMQRAIPTGSGNGWYTYNMEEHTINAAPDKVIVIKDASGKYIKLQVQSYYKDGKPYEAGAHYTLRYTQIQ